MSDGLVGDAQALEQADQPGVVQLVVNDEAGIDVVSLVPELDSDRIGVPTRTVVALEHGDVVASAQEMGAGQAGDPRPDDGDAHESVRSSGRRGSSTGPTLVTRGPPDPDLI